MVCVMSHGWHALSCLSSIVIKSVMLLGCTQSCERYMCLLQEIERRRQHLQEQRQRLIEAKKKERDDALSKAISKKEVCMTHVSQRGFQLCCV
jgi:hypothetical protein